MKITLTKQKIINAIAKEAHLKPGSFCSLADNRRHCEACAVGSVMRAVAAKVAPEADRHAIDAACWRNMGIRATPDIDSFYQDEAIALAREGEFWPALSVFFEGVSLKFKTTAARRKRTIEFVKKHFPKTVDLDVGALKERHV